ncbi:glycosyl hydrolase family 65 protein [Streptomyces sp. RFCAC02]|uniref:glycoside hydrolase family 65 protein n=1 Tax=Streptomyces sp. RFCAC02 TaxID=2499143 RepID=UPI00101F3D79|nr:glycosyl hydrolase family 65 protein [Streptomyces sp. RFCAC02]
MTDADWIWSYDGYDPPAERLREALCTLGNGYFATRGAAPEAPAGPAHYPGTYAAGLYNRKPTLLAGRRLEHEDMVNLPNWLPLRFRIHPDGGPDGDWFTPDDAAGGELLLHRQALDMRRGTLNRWIRYRDAHGRHTHVEQSRLVHMGDPHLAALRTKFTAEDWEGTVEVESAIDGMVGNTGVARYSDLASHHLTVMQTGAAADADDDPGIVWLRCRTGESDIRIVVAARTRAEPDGEPEHIRTHQSDFRVSQVLTLPVGPDRPAAVEKTVALHTSRDPAISSPLSAALDRVRRAPDYATLLDSHLMAWDRLWRHAELEVPGEAGHVLRLHLFHLLGTLSPAHTAELDVGVPARGLHGEAYRGHVFWDELFVLPYLNLHFPDLSRALMNYRYRRLPEAMRSAAAIGRGGAMYPWQSGSDGREETPEVHLNPKSGRWLPDNSRLQHHVGSAVAYNVWRYGQVTGDTEFAHSRGAEMLFQIARFWAESAVYDRQHERYRILGVLGPDEYHDGYPDRDTSGLDDNAYTNVLAAWVLARAVDLARTLPRSRRAEVFERVELRAGETDEWDDISRRLRVPFHRGVVSQFEGYGDLAELDWDAYRSRYGDIRRLDRILESEGDSPNRYQASKQADTLMLGYLFQPRELAEIFHRLGYAEMDDDMWRRTVDYYLARTSHGSTLSGVVHAWVLARTRHGEAWTHLRDALASDVADLQGGTTEEGIHLGAMAGTLDLVQRGLTGLETREGALLLDPAPLPELSEYAFSVRFRGVAVRMRLQPGQMRISVPEWEEAPACVVLHGDAVEIAPGEERLLPL